jgi:hypothetical protein
MYHSALGSSGKSTLLNRKRRPSSGETHDPPALLRQARSRPRWCSSPPSSTHGKPIRIQRLATSEDWQPDISTRVWPRLVDGLWINTDVPVNSCGSAHFV